MFNAWKGRKLTAFKTGYILLFMKGSINMQYRRMLAARDYFELAFDSGETLPYMILKNCDRVTLPAIVRPGLLTEAPPRFFCAKGKSMFNRRKLFKTTFPALALLIVFSLPAPDAFTESSVAPLLVAPFLGARST